MNWESARTGKCDSEWLEDARVYILAESIANEIWNEVIGWEYFARDTIGKQSVKAADSISASIVESYGPYHSRDVANFLYHVRGSLDEIQSWLVKARKERLTRPAIFVQYADDLA